MYSDLSDQVETFQDGLFELTNELNKIDLTLSELENESHKDRHTLETAVCKTYQVSEATVAMRDHCPLKKKYMYAVHKKNENYLYGC